MDLKEIICVLFFTMLQNIAMSPHSTPHLHLLLICSAGMEVLLETFNRIPLLSLFLWAWIPLIATYLSGFRRVVEMRMAQWPPQRISRVPSISYRHCSSSMSGPAVNSRWHILGSTCLLTDSSHSFYCLSKIFSWYKSLHSTLSFIPEISSFF